MSSSTPTSDAEYVELLEGAVRIMNTVNSQMKEVVAGLREIKERLGAVVAEQEATRDALAVIAQEAGA